MHSPSQQRDGDPVASVTDVWLVEDNALYLHTISGLIQEQDDLRCGLAASTCEEALAALRSGDVPDIVLMDLGLPGMDGVAGTRQILQLAPSSRVIILTVHDERDVVFRAIEAGASGYLLKTLPAERLVESIREVRDGGAPLNAHIARKILDTLGRSDGAAEQYGLTAREREILQLLVEGLTMRRLADRLHLSFHTIDTHVRNIYAKLQVRSRGSAVAKALRERLL